MVRAGGDLAVPGLLWVLMITSAENRGWPGDIGLDPGGETGLTAPSIIRTAKIATIEATEAQTIGILPAAQKGEVVALLSAAFAATATRPSLHADNPEFSGPQ